jgi:gamma-D-glutamyl-L-lysine dipeptidyl-peptidase
MSTDPQSVLDFLKEQKWAEARTTVFDVQAELADQTVRLTGQVLEEEQRAQAEQVIRQAYPGLDIANNIIVLSRPDTPWALSNGALSNLRKTPSNKSEIVAQALFGEPVELLHRNGEGWWFVRLNDGYLGWTVESYLSPCDRPDALGYRAKSDALVLAGLAQVYSRPEESVERLVGRLPFGVPVKVAERRGEMARVNWEGTPALWVAERDLMPMAQRPRPDAAGIARTLELMSRFMGVPYLWGGETPFGFDCSGFAQTAMEFMGLGVPRDADLQCFAARPVEGEPRPGDLLFFGDKTADAPEAERLSAITHVAVSLGGPEFIHATQITWGVQRNSLDPLSPIYRPWLKEHLVAVRTFL